MPNSIDEPLPIQVSASSAQAAILAALRVLLTVGALFGLLAKGDLNGVYGFFQGNEGYAFIAAIIAIVTFCTSLWITIQKHRKLVIVADAAPNSVAKVTS